MLPVMVPGTLAQAGIGLLCGVAGAGTMLSSLPAPWCLHSLTCSQQAGAALPQVDGSQGREAPCGQGGVGTL